MTSPDLQWYYRINLLASGTYPWVPVDEEEGLHIQATGYVQLPSGIRMPALARQGLTDDDLA